MFHIYFLCAIKKRCPGIGKTKRGKGAKVMAMTDASGLPIAIDSHSAILHEVKLVSQTLDARIINETPEKQIAVRTYECDPLDQYLKSNNDLQLIAPHKKIAKSSQLKMV